MLKNIECTNIFCINNTNKHCMLYDRKSQINKCISNNRFKSVFLDVKTFINNFNKTIEKVSSETLSFDELINEMVEISKSLNIQYKLNNEGEEIATPEKSSNGEWKDFAMH